MKLIPASRARWTIAIDSSWSGLPKAPNIIAPRQSWLTEMPVRPSGRYSMGLLKWIACPLSLAERLSGSGREGAGPAGAEATARRSGRRAEALQGRVEDRLDQAGGAPDLADGDDQLEDLGEAQVLPDFPRLLRRGEQRLARRHHPGAVLVEDGAVVVLDQQL